MSGALRVPVAGAGESSGSLLWQPLVEGRAAAPAWRVILDLADELASPPVAGAAPGAGPPRPSLAGGSAGLAIFFSYLDRVLPEAGYGEAAERWLDLAIEALAARALGADLYSGFAGIGWTVDHLAGAPAEADPGAEAHPLDAAVLRALEPAGVLGANFDLASGVVGLGLYALEGGARRTALRCADAVLTRLEELAVPVAGGLGWATPAGHPARGPGRSAAIARFNLGMAHGVPAVVALLASYIEAGRQPRRCAALLSPAVTWLLDQRLAGDGEARFSYWSGEGAETGPARLAWCYGDLGIACALLRAAASTGNAAWRNEALAIAGGAAARRGGGTGVVDAGLCHGAAGAAHLFNRLFQASGDARLARAARRWLGRTLELRRPGERVAGFPALEVDDHGELVPRADPGLLNGAAGVGLALLAAVSNVEPRWDRMLLLS